ncbi:MAG: mechanosensitive ion channel family protein [Candidatus Bathyarchaeota archaeon]|nr:mechanosensitive ion channel family protein [Candidatus Bathyarchaeota archaeon]
MPQIPAVFVDIIVKLIFSLVVLIATMATHVAVGNVLRRTVQDPTHTQTVRMLVRNTVFSVGSALILFIWLGFGNFAVFMGILGAGVAFASQEVIGSFAGYLNIVTGNLFRIGDRVRIGNAVGDVLDISLLRTTLMEIGEWVKADQYTGRIVSLANRVVFSDPVFNYTQHWHYLWDEITIPVTYDSNWRRAGDLMLEHVQEYSSQLQPQAQAELRKMIERYPVHDSPVEPMLYVVLTDNWIEMTLRYIVEARNRREVKGKLHRELLQQFESQTDIRVASATFEIVGFPPLKSAS